MKRIPVAGKHSIQCGRHNDYIGRPFECICPTLMKTSDDVNHPTHYTSHPTGIECIEITEHLNFNLGNAVKYIWRAGLKSPDALKDLKKAEWYVAREIKRLSKESP